MSDRSGLLRRFPVRVLEGIAPIDRSKVKIDLVAGVTLAALAIPEVMGYTQIAGMPVITGLYTILFPLALYAILGSSRHLVVGADSATAAILAAGLAGMAATASDQYVALAGVVALMTAGFLIFARIVKLGFLADFLSRTVLIGFLTGVGIQVAAGQVGGMLGVPEGTGRTLQKLWGTLQNIGDTNWETLVVSLCVIALIVSSRFVKLPIPGALIAVVGSIIVSWAVDLAADGVAVLGPVPGGLPSFAWPQGVSWSEASELVATAFSIFVVILAQSAATSRAYAAKYRDRFSEDTDLVGLGGANIMAGLTGTFVVNGSPTKTQMVDDAGGKSQIAAVMCAVVVAVVLLFLTKPLQYMPQAVLSAVVFVIGIELVAIGGMRRILRVRPDEFVVAAITAVVVIVVGVKQAILLAIVLSIIDHLRRSYRPKDTLLLRGARAGWTSVPVENGGELEPGLVVYRFAASLYYANANQFAEEIRQLATAEPGPAWICLDASAIADVDYTGGETLKTVHDELAALGVRLVLVHTSEDVRAQLDRYGVTEQLGQDAYMDSTDQLLEQYGKAPPPRPVAPLQ
jgi:SulP family sulfate permease